MSMMALVSEDEEFLLHDRDRNVGMENVGQCDDINIAEQESIA